MVVADGLVVVAFRPDVVATTESGLEAVENEQYNATVEKTTGSPHEEMWSKQARFNSNACAPLENGET